MRNTELDDDDKSQSRCRVLNKLRYADDTALAAESENDFRSLIQKVKNTSGKAGLYLNIKKAKVMTNSGLASLTVVERILKL